MNDTDYLKQIRRLAIGLAVSGSFNIILLALFFYWMINERPPAPYYELKPATKEEQQAPLAIDHSNSELLRYFRTLPMVQLIVKLNNAQLVENGYTQRDLALACLAAFHHFDLARALMGQPGQQRIIAYGKRPNGSPAEIVVYPGLTEQQFQTIVNFAQTERWPQTPKGLLLLLQKNECKEDPSLTDAFALTPEFAAVENLFNRSEISVGKARLVKMLAEGDWKMLSSFMEHQRKAQDLSPARRQRFLLDYIEHGSKSAAYLILKTDAAFASKKLDDHHIITLLDLLDEKTPEAEQFALELLASPRRDAVWQKAAGRLYEYAGEEKPENGVHQAALLRFLPNTPFIQGLEKPQALAKINVNATRVPKPLTAIPKKNTPPIQKQEGLYIVQEGDSLWKISRRFKVDIESLKQFNRLESDFLKPGTPLRIP